MSRTSDMTLERFDALKVENRTLSAALGAESERLTAALDALHELLTLPPPGDAAMPFYFTVRDIARVGILGKQ